MLHVPLRLRSQQDEATARRGETGATALSNFVCMKTFFSQKTRFTH